ncbi:SMP-30/gluconolactonase/LRE family protein [Niveispirillum sp. KHB5.9]|uniref:SMP-30/gluconolactonase/LRE family protein n=1 Tax=Niveispirillum sp. KHB5.9 TaxID=3400269 RepID=UPI003A8AA4B2
MSSPEALPVTCDVGEGPHWHPAHDRWSWIDGGGGGMHLWDGTRLRSIDPGVPLALAVPKAAGGWLLATHDRIADFTEGGRPIPRPTPPLDGARFNDGKCDRLGRLWIGSMGLAGAPGLGTLYRVDGDIMHMDRGFDVCNGIGFSPDDRWFYLTDTGQRLIYRYAFDLKTGRLGPREMLFRFPVSMGKPDGLAVDVQGRIWSALWDGAAIACLSPDGQLLDLLPVLVPRPTSLAFAPGCMLVTTARRGLSDAQLRDTPLSGRPLVFKTAVEGLAVSVFGW